MDSLNQRSIGRRPVFHDTDAIYFLPNDSVEAERLEYQHKAFVSLAKGRLIHAPVELSHCKVVDIGCGPGIVSRHLSSLADSESHILGIDLSPVKQRPGDDKLTNLSFVQGDFRKMVGVDSRLQSDSVDFAYSRALIFGMTDWPGYVRDVFKIVKPGGWAELDDYVEDTFYYNRAEHDEPPAGTPIIPSHDWEWLRAMRAKGQRQGLDLDCGLNIPRYMREAGFKDVQTFRYRIPFWRSAVETMPETQEVIELTVDDKQGLYWHTIPKFLKGENGYTEEDLERLQKQNQYDLREEEGKEHIYCCTIGRKPDA